MKIFKVLPNSYVYPAVLVGAGCFSVTSRAIHTIDEYWEFTEDQYKVVEYDNIEGLEKYGTGAVGKYFWIRLPKHVEMNLDTNAARYTGTPFMETFMIYGFYVHISRIQTMYGSDVYDIGP
jgi:hypothetical protein